MEKYEIKRTQSEELSYTDILRRGGNIVVPLIQRDYAHGRNTEKVCHIRKSFVSELHKCLRTMRTF